MTFEKKLTWLSIAAMSTMIIFASIGKTEPATTLESLQQSFMSQKERLMYNYLQKLAALEITILTSNDLRGANRVKIEIAKIKEEIKKTPKIHPAKKAATVVAVRKTTPKPVIKRRDPKTHTSEVEGLAGAASFSKNNIYKFHLTDVGTVSTLKFWSTGRRSTDSAGNVWLVTPYGQRKKIKKWKERYFDEPATEISSYKKINPITEDISKLVTKPGNYKVEFEWTGGIDPLVIYRVELTS